MEFSTIDHIRNSLRHPLPGKEAQFEMAPANRGAYFDIPTRYRSASVLALIYPKSKNWHVVFIQRNANDTNDKHAGQISLPGGKLENSDKSLEACALREVQEELGVFPNDINIIGQLSSLYVHVSAYLVHPFIGYIKYSPNFSLQYSEVENIIEVPIAYLMNPAIKKKKDMVIRNLTLRNIPYFDLFGATLWGATAMITNEFIQIVNRDHGRYQFQMN